MGNRAYRRHMEDVKVIRRLKIKIRELWYISDCNGMNFKNGRWMDLIGTDTAWDSMTMSTDNWASRNKTKWGSKSKRRKYWDSSDPWTRVKDKERFKKEMDYEGYKHLPTRPRREFELEGQE